MPDPLKPYRSALERLCGRPPFVLPPPYRQGHFRTDPFPEGLCPQGLELRSRGRSFFLSLTDSALLRAARELSGEDGVKLEPSSSFEHTLLVQALRPPEGEPAPRALPAQERALLRAALDLPRLRPERPGARRFVAQCLRLLDAQLALSLAGGGVSPALRASAACFAAYPALWDETNGKPDAPPDGGASSIFKGLPLDGLRRIGGTSFMRIQWLGHSSFRLMGKKTVVTDPFEGIGFPFPKVSADVITVSHGHHDHNAVENVGSDPAVVDDAGRHSVSGINVTGFSCYHDAEKGAQRGGNIAYLIEMEGLRIVHLGDLGCKLPNDVAQALQNPDLLLLPVGGHYTIDAAQAMEVMEQLSPKTTVPMHYLVEDLRVEVAPVDEFLRLVGEYTLIPGCEMELSPNLPSVVVFGDRYRDAQE